MSGWIDISQVLTEKIPVWPGDSPFTYRLTWSKEETGSVNVGQVVMSTHTGTHIDAPFHFDSDGRRVIDLDTDLYIGNARVIHLHRPRAITSQELSGKDLTGLTRLLIRTDAWTERSAFPSSIPAIDPDLAPWLSQKGIRLVGLDLPSVDPLNSKALPAHHALNHHGIHILEGLVLDHVAPGDYELVALPLPLADGDGSPVRAVLKPQKT